VFALYFKIEQWCNFVTDVTDLKRSVLGRVRSAADSLYTYSEFSESAAIGTAEEDGAGA
jgi:hypothetical protein